MVKIFFCETSKSLKILSKWLSWKNFFFAFYVFINSGNCSKQPYVDSIFIYLSKKRPKTNFKSKTKSFNSRFWTQWKDWKSSYQVGQTLAHLWNLIALISSQNCVKSFRVITIFKEIKFEGVWGKLETKTWDNYSQNIRTNSRFHVK